MPNVLVYLVATVQLFLSVATEEGCYIVDVAAIVIVWLVLPIATTATYLKCLLRKRSHIFKGFFLWLVCFPQALGQVMVSNNSCGVLWAVIGSLLVSRFLQMVWL